MPNRHRTSEELEFNKIVGTNIKFLRIKKNLNQTKVGQAIGTTYQQIQKYEHGTNAVSSIKLKKIAKKFNVSIDVLTDPMMIAKYKGFTEDGKIYSKDSFDMPIKITQIKLKNKEDHISDAYINEDKKFYKNEHNQN